MNPNSEVHPASEGMSQTKQPRTAALQSRSSHAGKRAQIKSGGFTGADTLRLWRAAVLRLLRAAPRSAAPDFGMKPLRPRSQAGIALIMVMLIVVVFAILAGGLAYTMKVETKLARNANWDTELEWLGRSGIELAKYVLSQPSKGPQGGYDGLNQIWAGGTGETNDALEGISLTDNKLGHGTFSVKITDADRKFDINLVDRFPEVFRQGLILMGVDGAETPRLANAIGDWIDPDDEPRVGSSDTESSYYLSLNPPYKAKNGPIDDLTELMMIKGITPAMYYGSGSGLAGSVDQQKRNQASARFNRDVGNEPTYAVGMVDLFTAISGRLININTASATVLQLIPEVDGNMAQAIITARAGPNGAEGDEDDMPFHNPAEAANAIGVPQMAPLFTKLFGVRSTTFEVTVDCQIDAVQRTFHAVLRRNGAQLVTLYMYWE